MNTILADPYHKFAATLASAVVNEQQRLEPDPNRAERMSTVNENGELVFLNLVPVRAAPSEPTAAAFFADVRSLEHLFSAYREAAQVLPLETSLAAARQRVHPFAQQFLDGLFEHAKGSLQDRDAIRIAQWVKHFDIYVAVKVIESLFNSKADLALLELSEEHGWFAHFDHLAIRCGSAETRAAESVAELLCNEHGYVRSQLEDEVYYQFADGWSAYLLYKVLDNGQVLRLFIDQSDVGHPTQIIQHWNHVYGYTAHHLAIRATRSENGTRVAVTLDELIHALSQRGIGIMEPTGYYTDGLLLQVFTQPERTTRIPEEITSRLLAYGAGIEKKIVNGKLLELVARQEMRPEFAAGYYRLYGLDYQPDNALHSAPIYGYFLPEQAAHVIRTSLIT
ncbi:MAG: hypothetical protein ACREYF_10145 [Gammaproteobacteria bacterium]